MNPVYEKLLSHYERTGKILTAEQVIDELKSVRAGQLQSGVIQFSDYLDAHRRKRA